MSAPDLADVQAADDLYETARQALEDVTAIRQRLQESVTAMQSHADYWCGLEAQAIVAVERAAQEVRSLRKAAGLVLTASGYKAAS